MAKRKQYQVKRIHTCEKDCYGACVYEAVWDDAAKRMVSATPLLSHPFTHGFFCNKYSDRPGVLYHPDRLREPLVRHGQKGTNDLVRIENEEAWRVLGTRTREIIDIHGPKAILGVYYSGNSGIIANNYPLRFFGAIGATVTGGGICNEGGIAGLQQLFGVYSTTNPFQLISPEARLIVVWGSDLAAHNIHAHAMVLKAVSHGAKLVVVDTRRTETAIKADLFIHTVPDTEGLIALLVLKHVLALGGHDRDFLDAHVNGHKSVERFVNGFEEGSIISGTNVAVHDIETLAAMLVEYRGHTIFNIGFGLQKYVHGGENVKAIALLQVFLGNMGKQGCGVIYSQSGMRRDVFTAIANHASAASVLGPTREVPLIGLANALETGEYKMLVVYDCNPASSLPDQERLRKQLARDDLFIVVHELHLNATTRFADMVFPAKCAPETDDLVCGYYIPGISITRGGPCPYPSCTSNAGFFRRLAKESCLAASQHATLLDEPEDLVVDHCLDLAGDDVKRDVLRNGYHLYVDEDTILFDNLHFPTADGRVHAAIPLISLATTSKYQTNEFFLITPMHRQFIHSQLGEVNVPAQEDFDYVYMHPTDIAALALKGGDRVMVTLGELQMPYILSPDPNLLPGTTLIYSGGPSKADGRRNANFFTPGTPELLGGSGSYNSGRIRIRKG